MNYAGADMALAEAYARGDDLKERLRLAESELTALRPVVDAVLMPDDPYALLGAKSGDKQMNDQIPASVIPNVAPPGLIWVCGACGKTTKDRYGEEGGWDESCMLNSVLCEDVSLVRNASGYVVRLSAPSEAVRALPPEWREGSQ